MLHTSLKIIVTKGYVKLLKYGDSLYRCKCVKVVALGHMCTVIKRVDPSLAYLEQVRQHMARLPSIDPNTRTVLICGYPNVGKSSFINKIMRVDVDVQPYAFTTKSLFVVLFHNIKSLFMNKSLIIVCNKTDLQPLEGISKENMKLVNEMKAEALKTLVGQGGEPTDNNSVLLTVSTLTEKEQLL
ncbi:Nucleolar GTP-binding protein 1 [Glycine soja]